MKIKTYQFGEIHYTDDKIINFENGLFGFEDLQKFLFIKPDDSFFYWLNAIERPEIAFPLFGLRAIDDEFPQEEEAEAFGIVKLNNDPLKITLNMKAPVYINEKDKEGFQRIIDSERFLINYNLFTE